VSHSTWRKTKGAQSFSGTEATMSAIRLARGHTGRDKIIKFEGCYHGHSDSLLIKAGSGALTLGVPSSPGVPAGLAEHTVTLPFNDAEAAKTAFAEIGDQIACVIVEPIAGNMNMVPPVAGYAGIPVAVESEGGMFGIAPDITTLGKVIGGGMPAAAYAGRAVIMASIAPDGPVYQAGTLSGNPVAMAAGLKTLELIDDDEFWSTLSAKTRYLDAGIPVAVESEGGMFGMVFTDQGPVRSYEQVAAADIERFRTFFHGMLDEGIYFAPSAFEAGFVSAAHSDDDLDQTIAAAAKVFATL